MSHNYEEEEDLVDFEIMDGDDDLVGDDDVIDPKEEDLDLEDPEDKFH